MVADEARSLRASMSVIDTNEGRAIGGLDLALILDNLIGLNHGKREFTIAVLIKVSPPYKQVFNGGVLDLILAHTRILPDWFPTSPRYPCQPRKHPSFPFPTIPFCILTPKIPTDFLFPKSSTEVWDCEQYSTLPPNPRNFRLRQRWRKPRRERELW